MSSLSDPLPQPFVGSLGSLWTFDIARIRPDHMAGSSIHLHTVFAYIKTHASCEKTFTVDVVSCSAVHGSLL
jgi:hypothetical protein